MHAFAAASGDYVVAARLDDQTVELLHFHLARDEAERLAAKTGRPHATLIGRLLERGEQPPVFYVAPPR